MVITVTPVYVENDLIGLTSTNITFPSYFLNLSNGIIAKNSILTVSNTFFEEFT